MAELANAKYEKFAQGLASGLSQRKAYRAAFKNSVKWKDATVDNRASELAKTSEVLGRLKELSEQATSKAIMDITERREWLSKIVRNDEEERKDQLKAVDLLNRMEGAYVENIQVKGQLNNPYSSLSTEELKRLIK